MTTGQRVSVRRSRGRTLHALPVLGPRKRPTRVQPLRGVPPGSRAYEYGLEPPREKAAEEKAAEEKADEKAVYGGGN